MGVVEWGIPIWWHMSHTAMPRFFRFTRGGRRMLYRDEHWQIAADLFARTWPPPPQPLQVTSLIAIQLHEQANIFKTDNHKFDPQAWFQLVITKRDEYWAAKAATA